MVSAIQGKMFYSVLSVPPIIETFTPRTIINGLKVWQTQKRKICVPSFTFSNLLHASLSPVFVGIESGSGLSFPAESWEIQTYMSIPRTAHPQGLVQLPVASKFFQLLPMNFNEHSASHMTEMIYYLCILMSIQRYKTKMTNRDKQTWSLWPGACLDSKNFRRWEADCWASFYGARVANISPLCLVWQLYSETCTCQSFSWYKSRICHGWGFCPMPPHLPNTQYLSGHFSQSPVVWLKCVGTVKCQNFQVLKLTIFTEIAMTTWSDGVKSFVVWTLAPVPWAEVA